MIILFLLNLIVFYGAFLITGKILRIRNIVDACISVFVIYFTQIILTELILGISGRLYLGYLTALNLLVFAAILLISWCRKPDFISFDAQRLLAQILSNRIYLLACCVIFAFALVKIFINLVNPPFGWDSLNYHFTFAVEWLKHGNLDVPITVSDVPYPSYFPINGSLYFLWLMMPLRNVFLADLGQVPFFILSVLSVFNISRKLGVSRERSFYAAALFFLIPNFFKQLQIAYVDVMVCGLFLASVNYLLLLEENFDWRNLLIFSLSLGLAVGTKTLSLPYAILLLIPVFYLGLKNLRKAYLLGIVILAVLALGGFSYLRNFFETGNPLYPMSYSLFGREIFKGVMASKVFAVDFQAQDYSALKLLFHEGLGVQSLFFILPGMFLLIPAILAKREKINLLRGFLFLLPIFLYLAYRFVIPLPNSRYLFPLLGLGTALGFYLTKVLALPGLLVNIAVVISIFASISELAKRQELVVSLLMAILLFLLLVFFGKPQRPIRLVKKPVLIFALVILLLGLRLLQPYYLRHEYSQYTKMAKYSGFWPDATKAWEWLNKNTSGNNIAYIGRPVPFPLYGSSFKNNVYYVSVNKTDPAKLHYFSQGHYNWQKDFRSLHRNLEEKGNYRENADYGTWLNNLMSKKTDYLFIYSLHQIEGVEFPIEDFWAKSHPQEFNPVFENNTIHIYKIRS